MAMYSRYHSTQSTKPGVRPRQSPPLRRQVPGPKPKSFWFRASWRRPGAAIVVLLCLVLGGYGVWAQHVSAQAASRAERAALQAQAKTRAQVFQYQLQAITAANPAVNVSVAIRSQELGAQYYGVPGNYDGASIGKLITAADYLHHVETGHASLSRTIDGQSAQHLLQIMVVNSDDTAWAELNDYLTHADLSAYASSLGLSNYDAATDNFSAGNIADLLEQLQTGRLLNVKDSQLLLGYMKVANYRDYIVPAVPRGYSVYHKVGLDNDDVHDAAIITRAGKSIELVIFTNGNGSYDWQSRAAMMQLITKDALAAYLPK